MTFLNMDPKERPGQEQQSLHVALAHAFVPEGEDGQPLLSRFCRVLTRKSWNRTLLCGLESRDKPSTNQNNAQLVWVRGCVYCM